MGNNISDKDLEVLMKKAESGDAEAQTQLGYYHRGTGDERQAMAWFTKAANQGNLDAQCEQALYYIRVGGKKFVQKAIECINKAVSQGSPKALDLLGQVYEAGKGVKMNKKRALECYAGAAEKGYVSSYFNAGKIEDEPEKAIEWFSKGAELGDRRCILEMADKYFNGDGVEQDYEKSKALYKKIGAIKVFNQMLPKKMKHLADNSEDEKYEKEIIELMKGHGLKELLLQMRNKESDGGWEYFDELDDPSCIQYPAGDDENEYRIVRLGIIDEKLKMRVQLLEDMGSQWLPKIENTRWRDFREYAEDSYPSLLLDFLREYDVAFEYTKAHPKLLVLKS